MKKIIRQASFSLGWNLLKEKPTVSSDGFFSMRGWQAEAFDLLKSSNRIIINAPMGSGKSLEMCFLSAHKLKKSKSLRCIFSVPQTIIANGFAEASLIMPDGEKVNWLAQHNLCADRLNDGIVSHLIKWLEGPYGSFADRVTICTHATLVAAYKRLRSQSRLDLLDNLLLWVDEAHHVKNVALEGMENAVVSNGIGELVAHLLSRKNSQVGLATASFFRGDRCSLLAEHMESKFVRYNLPYDKYFEQMQHLRSFSYDFLICGQDYVKAIDSLIKSRSGKDIIYIPHPISRHSSGNKYEEVERLIEQYKKHKGGKVIDTVDGLTLLNGGNFKIMDLVDEDRRNEKKAYINGIKSKEDLDAIIALGMFKEGANWIWADRSIIVGARNSLVDVIQMIGRLFRDAPDKSHVEVIHLLPFSLDQKDEENFRDNLNDYLKAIYASLILENVLRPVKIKMKMKEEKVDSGSGSSKADWLADALPDESKQLSLLEDVSEKLLDLVNYGNADSLHEEYQKVLPGILGEYGITESVEEVGRQIWSMFTRRTLKMQGIDVEHIDFDILKKTNPLDCLLRFTSNACDINTFKKLRESIGGLRKTAKEWVHEAEILAKANDGLLPNCGWLVKNGYIGLDQTIRAYPELFAHIEQDYRGGKTTKEQVLEAEELAENHGGILPNYKWLEKNGYSGLNGAMRNHPKLFAHIEQDYRGGKTTKEQVLEAEELAENHGGILPNYRWLVNNGYSGLAQAMRKCPELFTHIKKDYKGGKNAKERVLEAEELAENHGGVLPNYSWLVNNGYSWLNEAMRKYPELFVHLEQNHKGWNSPEEWVPKAEELAENHGGILPNYRWLVNNGYNGLAQAMRKCPELFTHIKKYYKGGKNVENHIVEAEELSKSNGGVLPNPNWLVNNGYSGLAQAMRKWPELFTHIEQDYRGGKTVEEWLPKSEELAKSHGGVLPNPNWLVNNGYSGLAQTMRNHPKSFAHIEQDYKGGNTVEDWLLTAKKLAKNNRGILPNCHWLIKNGYSGLYTAIKKHPALFAEIKQDYRGGKSPQEWVPDAEKLAKDSGGILPNYGWLQKNGYAGLAMAIKKQPELFTHIEQDYKGGKIAEEWVPDAEKLAKDNGGMLPSCKWLQKNGYSGLDKAIRKYPKLFAHIPAKRRKLL